MWQSMGWPAKQKTVMEWLWLMSSYFKPFVNSKCWKHCVLDDVSGFIFKEAWCLLYSGDFCPLFNFLHRLLWPFISSAHKFQMLHFCLFVPSSIFLRC